MSTSLAVRTASPLRRAAIALVALGPERSREVLKGMSEEQVRAVALEIAELGPVSPDEVRQTMGALATGLGGIGMLPAPGRQYARDMLVSALGVDRGEIAAFDLDSGKPFGWLAEADPDAAAQALAGEPAGAVALALAHVEPRAAVKLLTRLPVEVRSAVAARIAALDVVHPGTLEEVEAGLRARLGNLLAVEVNRLTGPLVLASMLAQAPADQEKALLQAIAMTDPDVADAVKAALFTFADALSLEPRALQAVLKAVETRDLALALHNADEELSERVMSNLSERARVTLREEMDLLVRVRAPDVTAARQRVVAQARSLEEQGIIELTRAGAEDEQ